MYQTHLWNLSGTSVNGCGRRLSHLQIKVRSFYLLGKQHPIELFLWSTTVLDTKCQLLLVISVCWDNNKTQSFQLQVSKLILTLVSYHLTLIMQGGGGHNVPTTSRSPKTTVKQKKNCFWLKIYNVLGK